MMTGIILRDILIQARQESSRMRHWYLGVEHLFIALLEPQGGLTRTILQDHGLTPDYVIDAIRRRAGKGGRSRLWAGMPNTPRADVVLGIAHDLALESGREEIDERDLLMAILEEGDSTPVRVLRQFGVDLERMTGDAASRTVDVGAARSYLDVTFGRDYDPADVLADEQVFILRRMFQGYSQIRIERRLQGGYSRAVVLIVTPIQADNIEEAPLVVKIDRTDLILDEAKRYELHVKNTLPPLTARIEDKPTAPDTADLAGIKYTFVANHDGAPRDLRDVANEWSGERLSAWLQESLFASFGKTWWSQRRPYRFQAWMEYDWYLPPILTLEWLPDESDHPDAFVVRDPVRRARLTELEYGDVVLVDNFTVHKVYPDRNEIALTVGRGTEAARRAYQINVKEIDQSSDTFFRGEVVERMPGTVYKTRHEALRSAASATQPNFDLRAESLAGVAYASKLPNPLYGYDALLDVHINGSVSKIHGDLHLGNILVGPGDTPFLIDFAYTRDGHTLADWAALEVSLWADVVMPLAGQEWRDAYRVLEQVAGLNSGASAPSDDDMLDNALVPLRALREIVAGCLHTPDVWFEYYVALTFSALRALSWETRSLGSRRLMFLLAALTLYETKRRAQTGSSDTPSDGGLTDTGGSLTMM
jgi:hypothetical protein